MEHSVARAVSHLHHAAGSEMKRLGLVGAISCGSWLASDDADAVCQSMSAIAGKLAPTGFCVEVGNHG